MNARRYFYLLLVVFGLVFAPQLASCQVPTLWSKCLAAAFNNFVISWRAVEEEISGASKHEIEEFVTWTPELAAIGEATKIFSYSSGQGSTTEGGPIFGTSNPRRSLGPITAPLLL